MAKLSSLPTPEFAPMMYGCDCGETFRDYSAYMAHFGDAIGHADKVHEWKNGNKPASDVEAQSQLWSRFALSLIETKVFSLASRLVQSGQLKLLEKMGDLSEMKLSTLPGLFLPFYHSTDFGDGGWQFPDSPPYTLDEWISEFKDGKDVPQKERVTKLTKLAIPHLLGVGANILVVSNDHSRILVDGCHRALAASIAGGDPGVLVYTSVYAPLLFPCDFLAIELKAKRQLCT